MMNTAEPITHTQEKLDLLKPFKVGDIIQGVVAGIGRSSVYVDLGARGTGVIHGREFLDEKASLRDLKSGDPLTAKVINVEDEEGYVELSTRAAGRELVWSKLKEQRSTQEVLKVRITGANKGGLLAEVGRTPAFLPVSQLSSDHYPRVENGDAARILRELQKFVGEELDVQVLDLDPREEKIILSEKSKDREKLIQALGSFKVGDIVEGEITGVVDFGAFLKFSTAEEGKEPQELEGLIHISEIDWQIIDDPSKILKIGDRVKAKIIEISNSRVSLSLKALKDDPWKNVGEKYKKGETVKGIVTKINPFGAFIELEPKIQGLIHISEFGTRKKLEESIEQDKTYEFRIVDVNPEDHRMSLRLASAPDPEPSEQST